MDKYEYQVCVDEIKSLIAQHKFADAMKIADTIDWRKVRSVSMLCTISEIYKINKHYEESRDILLLAYERYPKGRMIVYALCELAIKLGDIYSAMEYYKEFMKIAPGDTGSYILLYKLYEATEVSLEERIQVLEEYKRQEYKEKWAYELAYLYHRIGERTKCIETCDELILWFGEGKYVKKAMELKMQHARLTKDQQMKYEGKEERLNTAPMPLYQQGDADRAPDNIPGSDDQLYGQMYGQKSAALPNTPKENKVQVTPVAANLYNTQNLQAELAQNMQSYLGEKQPSEVSSVTYSGDPSAYQQLYNKSDIDIPSSEIDDNMAGKEQAYSNPKYEMPKYEAPKYEEAKYDGQEHPTLNIPQPSYEIPKPVQVEPLVMDVPVQDTPHEDKNYDKLLGQGSDGQLKFTLPDQDMVEMQIPGQIELKDIFQNWDDMQKENDQKRIDEAKKKSLQQTNDILAQLKGVIPEIEEDPYYNNSVKSVKDSRPIMREVNAGSFAPEVGTLAGSSINTEPSEPVEDLSDVFSVNPSSDAGLEEDTAEEITEDSTIEESVEVPAEEVDLAPIEEVAQDTAEEIDEISESVEDGPDNEYSDSENLETEDLESGELEEIEETEAAEIAPEISDDFGTEESNEESEDAEEELAEESVEEPEALELTNESEDEEVNLVADDVPENLEDALSTEAENIVEDDTLRIHFTDAPKVTVPLYEEKSEELSDDIESDDETQTEEIEGIEEIEEIQEDLPEDIHEVVPDLSDEINEVTTNNYQDVNSYPYELDDYGEVEEIETINQPEEVDDILSRTKPLPIEAIQQAEYEAGIENSGEYEPDYALPAGYNQLLMQQEQQAKAKRIPRYMQAHEARKSRRDFDEEEIKIFGRYDGIEDLKAQIVDVMDDMSMEASHGNVVVMGKEPVGRKGLAIDIVRAIQIMDSTFSGKVAKISGEALNKKNIPLTLRKLQNGALIVENAGGLTMNSLSIMGEALIAEPDPVLVVLEGEKDTLAPLLDMSGSLTDQVFDSRIDIQDLTNDDLVSYGKGYAKEQGYVIDEMGILEFYTRIGELQTAEHMVSIDEVREIIDAAIKHVDRKNVSHLMDVLIGKRYDSDDFIVLREKDFQS